MAGRLGKLKLYWKKWRWFERNSFPLRRLRIHYEMMRRECYARWPVQGNLLEALKEGRLEMGSGVHFEHDVWISVLKNGHLKLGSGVALNDGVFISCFNEVEIGDNTGVGNGSFISDGMRGFNPNSRTPFMYQPMETKGPTRIGRNCWVGVNCIITSGVTIGDWCIIGANSVVTKDVPSYSVVGGVPARVLREVDRTSPETDVARAGAVAGSLE